MISDLRLHRVYRGSRFFKGTVSVWGWGWVSVVWVAVLQKGEKMSGNFTLPGEWSPGLYNTE